MKNNLCTKILAVGLLVAGVVGTASAGELADAPSGSPLKSVYSPGAKVQPSLLINCTQKGSCIFSSPNHLQYNGKVVTLYSSSAKPQPLIRFNCLKDGSCVFK